MKIRVLIVDDSQTVRQDLEDALQSAGFDTRSCEDAREARNAFLDGPYHLIILDVLLPDGSGFELLVEIRGTPALVDTPVMLLSGETKVSERIRGIESGADEYVGKPYDRSYVVSRVRELTRNRLRAEFSAEGPTVLIIEDSPTFASMLTHFLEEAGYRVTAVATGEEGLRRAQLDRPDALIVDGNLPGIDGTTVIRRVRMDTALQRMPCMMLTASESHRDEVTVLDSGADAFVSKSEDPAEMLIRLAAMLRMSQPRELSQELPSQFGPKKLLAVDDSPTFLMELSERLRQEGFDVVQAGSGEDALELLSVTPVDCVLLDLVMPGLDGHETCRRIKASAELRRIPVIVLTSVEDRESMLESIGAGADDYVSKAAEFEVLRARLQAQLRRRQYEDENRRIRDELVERQLEAAEARSIRAVANARAELLAKLERKNSELERKNLELRATNRELDAFTYSVSHDLHAPLRSISGFVEIIREDYGHLLDEVGLDYFARITRGSEQMGQLIEALLGLSRLSRADFVRGEVDLSALTREIVDERLLAVDPDRRCTVEIEEGLVTDADSNMLRAALDNLLRNAWKFTRTRAETRIAVGRELQAAEAVYFVRDNGVGFDPDYSEKLFAVFQRLHPVEEFEGTGVGLATAQRIVHRHGGRIWAESKPDEGATFYFTLGDNASDRGAT